MVEVGGSAWFMVEILVVVAVVYSSDCDCWH